MTDIFTQIFFPLSLGGVGGFLIGYATKKIIKLLLVLLGLYVLSLYYLTHVGVITVNSDKLLETILGFLAQIATSLSTIVTYLPLSASFLFGFVIGMMKG